MSGQNPVWKKYTQMNLKMELMTLEMGQGHIIIVKYLHHATYVNRCTITINIETVLTLLEVKAITTKANNNVDIKACFT